MTKYLSICLLLSLGACAPKAEPLATPLGDKIANKVKEAPTTPKVDNPTSQPQEVEKPVEEKPAFDHSAYDGLLKKYAKYEDGRVDYAGLAGEKAVLDAYVKSIAEADIAKLGPNDTKALLINAYNANTLSLILENYGKIKSIRDLDKPWKTVRYTVAGDKVSLDNIEHNLLRAVFKDPRIHFAANCASVGCPSLANFAYEGKTLDAQLEMVTRDSFNNPQHVKVQGNKLAVTSLLKWYGDDFTNKEWKPRAESLANFVATYADGEVKTFLEKNPDPKLRFQDYDWSLNDIKK